MKAKELQELTRALAELGYEIEGLEDGLYDETTHFRDGNRLRLTLKRKAQS